MDKDSALIEMFKNQHAESKNEIRELRIVTKEMSDNLVAFTGLVTRVEERSMQMQEFRLEVRDWQKKTEVDIRGLEKSTNMNSFISNGVIRNVEKIAQWIIIAALSYLYIK
jgi:DNA replicative helicase MCM subunit Mcm2 (Cdc46/Mcm family)